MNWLPQQGRWQARGNMEEEEEEERRWHVCGVVQG
jgi:hypothetical protein